MYPVVGVWEVRIVVEGEVDEIVLKSVDCFSGKSTY